MVKSNDDGSNSVAPFLNKCYEMVDDESTDSIISWGQSNESFVIWDVTEFSVQLLPRYFKHSNFSSFIRQLNIYVSFVLLLWEILHFSFCSYATVVLIFLSWNYVEIFWNGCLYLCWDCYWVSENSLFCFWVITSFIMRFWIAF